MTGVHTPAHCLILNSNRKWRAASSSVCDVDADLFHARWNCVDLACLVMGLLDLFPATYVDNPGPIVRVVRLLRPSRIMIRTNKLLAEVAMLTRLLVTSFKMLTNVFGLLLFIFFTFGILGVQLFQGFFRGRSAAPSVFPRIQFSPANTILP